MKLRGVLLPLLILISGCSASIVDKSVECNSDSDCAPAGCSSQLCVDANKASEVITTCEYREEYSCLRFTSCGCVNNKCEWANTAEYTECLEGVRG